MPQISRREFLKTAGTGALAVAAGMVIPDASDCSEEHSNTLLIVCDRLDQSMLGCRGGPMSTPNLDRLASRGMLSRSSADSLIAQVSARPRVLRFGRSRPHNERMLEFSGPALRDIACHGRMSGPKYQDCFDSLTARDVTDALTSISNGGPFSIVCSFALPWDPYAVFCSEYKAAGAVDHGLLRLLDLQVGKVLGVLDSVGQSSRTVTTLITGR